MAFPTQSINLVIASSQYTTAANSTSLQISTDFTMEGWIKLTNLPSTQGTQFQIMFKGDATNSDVYRLFIDNSDNKLYVHWTDTSQAHSTLFKMDLAFAAGDVGAWVHVAAACTIATPTVAFYKNGGSQSGTAVSTASTSLTTNTQTFFLGAWQDTGTAGRFFNGRLSLLRLWKTAVSGANVNANKCTELGTTTNLQGEWTFDNTLNDNSGNSNTLTGHGTPTFGTDVTSTCSVGGSGRAIPFFNLMGVGT